jgi:succinate dehydrogenase / fumarate reductase membrane anchor subunit
LILTIGIGLHHGQLGLQVVWEDYTEGGLRVVMIVLTKFIAVLFGLGAIVAIMRIGFGG